MKAETLFSSIVAIRPQFKTYCISPPLRPRSNNTVYLLTEKTKNPHRQNYFVKDFSSQPNPERWVATEVAATNLVQGNTKVRVPTSLPAVNHEAGLYCVIQNQLPGATLKKLLEVSDEPISLNPVVEQAGAVLAQIHAVSTDDFGDVVSAGKHFKTWGDCFEHYVCEQLVQALSIGLLRLPQVAFFEAKLANIFNIVGQPAETPILQHGNFSLTNLIVDFESQPAIGVIDFEHARFWVPEWDITRVAQTGIKDSKLFEIFVRAYAGSAGKNEEQLLEQVEVYKYFESLSFWIWGWNRSQELRQLVIGESRVKINEWTNS